MNLNRKVRICSTSDMTLVCGDSQKDKTKARGICMPSRMTCFINVITVVSVQTCLTLSKTETRNYTQNIV